MNTNKARIETICYLVAAFAMVCLVALSMTVSGCGGNGGNGGGAGSGGGGGGGGGGSGDTCSMSPMTHEEIINACTDAQSVDINPYFPASAPNGVLPALPN